MKSFDYMKAFDEEAHRTLMTMEVEHLAEIFVDTLYAYSRRLGMSPRTLLENTFKVSYSDSEWKHTILPKLETKVPV